VVKRWLPEGEFARNVLTLMSGTMLAQAIPVLISPALTRLYTPAQLGSLALFISLIAVGVVLATGRFELAIPIPRSHREAFDLTVVGISLAFVGCALAWVGLAALTMIPSYGVASFGPLGHWGYALPLGILLLGIYQCLSYWNNRNKRFGALSFSKVAQSGTVGTVQLASGLAGAGSAGLLGGYLLGQFAANAALLRSTARDAAGSTRRPSVAQACAVARRHAGFPRYMIPGQLANVASSQMPVLLLTLFYGPAIAGFYSLAERVLVLPLSIIGTAIGDVYRQRAAEEYQATGQCRELYLRTARRLALTAALPLLCVALLAPWLFGLVFGASWREAGHITSLLCAMVFCQVVSSPLSQTVLLADMHRLDMAWQFLRLALAAGSLYLGSVIWADHRVSIALFALSFSLLYALHSLMQYKAACGRSKRPPPTPPSTQGSAT
jgi:O-antigen/teichoic acid export membrane protein